MGSSRLAGCDSVPLPDGWLLEDVLKLPWSYLTVGKESAAPMLPKFVELHHPLGLQWLLVELLVSPTASGICLRIFLIPCSLPLMTQGPVGY